MVLSEAASAMLDSYDKIPNKKKWLDEAGSVLQFANALEERNSLVRGVILKVVREKWSSIRLEDKSLVYDFQEWAERITKKDSKTIDNWMRTARVFIFNPKGINFPKTVDYDIVTHTLNGRVTRETVTVDFDPEKIQHSKLVAACRQVSDNEMTDKKWSALASPHVGFSEFLGVLHGDGPTLKIKERNKSSVRREGPILYRHFGPDDDVEILEFNPSEFDDDTSRVREDIRDVMSFLGVS